MSLRLERVRELIKRELGEIIRRELPISEAGLISVNEVVMGSDLRSAIIFVGILGNAEQKKKGAAMLHKQAKHIQGLLGKSVTLKYTPHLKFVDDDSIERGNRVLRLLEELDKTSPPE